MKILASNEILNNLKEVLSKADREILISSAWISRDGIREIREELRNAVNRGVKIRVLIRSEKLEDLKISNTDMFRTIREIVGENNKTSVEIRAHPKLHAKFIVVDNKFAILGSANITYEGLNPHRGNEEVCVLIDASSEVQNLREIFEKLWNDASTIDYENVVGIISNPSRTSHIELFVLNDALMEGSYIVFESQGKRHIAQVIDIMSWNTAFFMNPFTTQPNAELFPPIEDLKLLFEGSKDPMWQMAMIRLFLSRESINIKTARAKILGYFDGGDLKPAFYPPPVGTMVYMATESDIHRIYNISRNSDNTGCNYIPVGVFANTDIKFYLNLDEVMSKHLAVIGTTGSGKSYFVKSFVSKSVDYVDKVYILDPHGEYKEHLVNIFGVPEVDIEELSVENTLFFTKPDGLKEFLGEYGLKISDKELDLSLVNWVLWTQGILDDPPDLDIVSYLEKKLEKIIGSNPKKSNPKNYGYSARIRILKESLSSVMPLENTNCKRIAELYQKIRDVIQNDKKVVIFNLREISDPKIRIEVAGAILREIYVVSKKNPRRSLLVLEEAHNFSPEGSYGDVKTGKDNPAQVYAQKIAAEGRKFGIGVIIVTQRPAQVSKYMLSQMNTYVLFRVLNYNDLKSIENSIESASRHIIERLSDLKTGYAFISGVGSPMPALVEIKKDFE